MFGPQDAEAYFSVLMNNPQHILWKIILPERIFYAAAPSGLESDQHNQETWAVDYAIRDTGSVIPQKIWTTRKRSDRQRYVFDEPLRPPIFFAHQDGGLGLPLTAAAAGGWTLLRNAEKVPYIGSSTHIQIRINVSSFFWTFIVRV